MSESSDEWQEPKESVTFTFHSFSQEQELRPITVGSGGNVDAVIRDIVAAIRVPGPGPEYHRQVMERHRQEWPTLWKHIDRLVQYHDARVSGP